jgi:hypothetical protein
LEWISYTQFINIKEIRKDEENLNIIYSSMWNNGPLVYDHDKKELR